MMKKAKDFFEKESTKLVLFIVLDIISIAISTLATLWIAYGMGKMPEEIAKGIFKVAPILLILTVGAYGVMGLHTTMWEHASAPEFINIAIANITATYIAFTLQGIVDAKIPNKFFLIHCAVMTIIVGATRHLYRTWRRVINGVDYSRSRKLKDESYIKSYYNIKGELKNRKLSKQIRVKIFAVIKYVFDRTMATLGLIIASPIMVVIAIIVKLESKGPIFFKQERTGKNGNNFYIYKFRTMVADNDVHNFDVEDQYTRIGNFLRKTSLDEIPQLFAIASGKMSFIGPRPWIPDYYANMDKIQRQRYIVRPGLTGLAQAMGRNNLTIFKKIEYDLIYIKNYSLAQDLLIILWTIKTILSKKGAEAGKTTIRAELNALKRKKAENEGA
ncbi:sugar transferase [Candidatus Saccharibacteria bacterium]|nr:sugar transferase [Candidatus Saccharibacteria bacterium]